MPIYPESFLEEVRSRNDIVEVVSERMMLKRKGTRFWGLCPFHGEKTPSFSVDADKQMFYCFGCHLGGTVFQFVMEYERMTFVEAVAYLAERARIPLPAIDPRKAAHEREALDRIYDVNKAAARYFHDLIWTEAGKPARDYLYDRGLTDTVIRRFGLGAASSGWEDCLSALTQEGFTRQDMIAAGLVVSKENRTYDMFRGRVIFPIIDMRGHVMGFGGRILGEGQPKYLNTSDTAAFNKRRNLYGLNLVKKHRNVDALILVEGYMDVVSLSRYGIHGCVATLGTALTDEQVHLLKRYAQQVIVAYDGDSAGRNATAKAVERLANNSVQVKVLDFPGGQDPDEFVRAQGVEAFRSLPYESGTGFLLAHAMSGVDMSTQEGKTQYAMAACSILKRIEQPVERENFLKRVAMETGFERQVLLEQMGVIQERPVQPNKDGKKRHTKPVSSSYEQAQRYLLAALATDPKRVQGVLNAEDFVDEPYKTIAARILAGESVGAILESIQDEKERALLAETLYEPIQMDETLPDLLSMWLNIVQLHRLEEELASIRTAMADTSRKPDPMLIQRLRVLTIEENRLKAAVRKE